MTATANPVPIGEEFELILTYDAPPDLDVIVLFARQIIDLPDWLIGDYIPMNTGTGDDVVVVSVPIVADETTLPDDGCGRFYINAYTAYYQPHHDNFVLVEYLTVCLQYESSTAAETVSRVLPVFRATVEGIEPATAMPSGEVEFYVGNTKVCTGELDESGEASCSSLNQVISLQSHYTAKYTGDGVFGPSEDQGSFSPF